MSEEPGPRGSFSGTAARPASPAEVANARTGSATGARTGSATDPDARLVSALASVLGHELRTPLTTIVAGSELLAVEHLAEASRTEAARSVALASARLARIVDDLMTLIRWDMDAPPDPEPVLVGRVLAAEIEQRRRLAPGSPIDLVVADNLPPVVANEVETEHALRNLLDHALANSPDGGRIDVRVALLGASVEVRIRDGGPGFDDAGAAGAFDLFGDTDRDAGDASGANLSMAVARRLIERVGGAVRAVPSDRGEVLVSLPVA